MNFDLSGVPEKLKLVTTSTKPHFVIWKLQIMIFMCKARSIEHSKNYISVVGGGRVTPTLTLRAVEKGMKMKQRMNMGKS